MKRTLIGFLWFVAFFCGSCMLLGAAIGTSAADEGYSEEEIEAVASETGYHLSGLIFAGSAGAAIYGTATKKLPGTK